MLGRSWRGLVCAVLLGACTKANPSATCSSGTCTDPDFPFCDMTGAISGTPGVCIAVSCSAGEVHSCDADQAWVCTATGDGYELMPCALGCNDTPTPHCAYLQPRYLPDACDTPAQQDQLSVTTSGTFDPNLDQTCTGGVVAQTGGPSMCVLRYRSITIASGASLSFSGKVGTDGRAVALVADNDVLVDGVLDVGAHARVNGPGGGTFSSGSGLGNGGGAGGGAGGATAGGSGGSGTSTAGGTDGGAQNGGPATVNPALLAALIGGGSSASSGGALYGGGGGALTVISCHGVVHVDGTINAGGGGGPGGSAPGGVVQLPGFGAGAGGNIVLQGTNVSILGSLFANGGAGGSGMYGATVGADGQDGASSDSMPANGGTNGGGGAGGTGGIGAMMPGAGGHPTQNNSTAGGGGGSVGFIQIYVPDKSAPTLTPSHVSPSLQPTGIALTR